MLLWMDGFDHYGTGSAGRLEMLDGVWAEAGSAASPSTVQSRTGGTSLLFAGIGTTGARRIFGATKTTVGVGFALYLDALPATANTQDIISFANSDNEPQIAILINTTGSVSIITGGSYGLSAPTVQATSADGVIVAEAFQHIEFKAFSNTTTGASEIRVNGVTVLTWTGNTTPQTPVGYAQVNFSRSIGGQTNAIDHYIDDVYAWDDSGTSNNDWMGDLRVGTIMPNDDTAQADWLLSAGVTGYTLIDEIPADDDTTYIYNESFGDGGEVSEFELQDLTGNIATIRGVQTYVKQRKTVAGTCNVQASIVSGTSVSVGDDNPITEAYTYWMDVHETDPATGAPWTKDGVDGMKLRIERTA